MPHVVTQACCGDASCVYACPVNCIHPTPDEPDFATSEMLYIDPSTCVDCGACVSACPVSAIVPGHRLDEHQLRFVDVNAEHYAGVDSVPAARFPVDTRTRLPLAPIGKPASLKVTDRQIDVAIVGSGPAAMYAADELLRYPEVRVTIFERLDKPFGLARFGVAPDHLSTRSVMRLFDEIAVNPHLTIRLGVEIGRDVTLAELRRTHRAVIWAGGAPTDRRLEIPGAELSGVASATSFVGWYNGHPDFADLDFDLDTERVVVVGNGNVALDAARILTSDPDALAQTSISRRALAVLRDSAVREVVVVGRRGPESAAFTMPELIGLVDGSGHGPGVRVGVDPVDLDGAPPAPGDEVVAAKLALLREVAGAAEGTGRRLRLAFLRTPAEVLAAGAGEKRVGGIRFLRNVRDETGLVVPGTETEDMSAGLVLSSIGYRGRPVDGLPFDTVRGVIPNEAGRVVADGQVETGMYVTGWIKRGPSGFIGTNKTDSVQTVTALREDLEAGRLPQPGAGQSGIGQSGPGHSGTGQSSTRLRTRDRLRSLR
ncbi:FAD-dependent oxidoreductase [Gordonia jinhuaensis]|uniref:ferredoxin--NADP(+) reductase n=1 Tax=Gordonia jinhuaensis TaxID=1517702 RepID=A0A916T6V8_9ACTN|nr:FAD-dependent oxidoreductase [Gordonia jinhuaensis]GGB33973.1 putative ferredoxin/ferredoxin--NADP reductase [Gordonia jinhuaensis]